MKLIDLTGKTFGRLTVLSKEDNVGTSGSRWLCQCQCRNTIIAASGNLRSGATNSCGRYKKEFMAKKNKANKKHGLYKHPLYQCWLNLRNRCNNPKHQSYKNYGGRGIKVCKEWNSFKTFLEDMGERPDRLSIDRINNDGNYEPLNCKWSTTKEQSRNKRKRK